MTSSENGGLNRKFEILNKKGLHARAAAKFVRCVEQFDAEITVTRQDNRVSGLSIMGLMMLAAAQGCHISITASGPQAGEAMDALAALIDARFDEE